MEQPGTNNVWKPDPAKGWITDEDGYKKLLQDNRIWWPPNAKTGKPRKKRFLSEAQTRMPASSFWTEFRAQSGAAEVDKIIGERVFAFPKPLNLIQKVIDHCAPPHCLVLDSFAGTGTTAHAVLAQNKADGGSRRFIIVEMEETICRDVTAQRIRKAIEGYGDTAGMGGEFRYCRLGPPVFDETGNIRAGVTFGELAAHVYFAETGEPLPKRPSPHPGPLPKGEGRRWSPLLGVHNGRAIYLLFNGILGDRSPGGGNVLTSKTLPMLPKPPSPPAPLPKGEGRIARIIYGEGSRLGNARLKREGIVFKQIPYGIKTS
jgi:site-specific DNA-methyltransferase (adenine-specific)/adenine-specific DNA-methyltransferase